MPQLCRVKIGRTTNLDARMDALCHTNGEDLRLRLVVSGIAKKERDLHKQFSEDRIWPNREWFHLSPTIELFIEGEITKRRKSFIFRDACRMPPGYALETYGGVYAIRKWDGETLGDIIAECDTPESLKAFRDS